MDETKVNASWKNFQISVFDFFVHISVRSWPSPFFYEEANVAIHVNSVRINDNDLQRAASVRIQNVSPQLFITSFGNEPSPLEKMRQFLSKIDPKINVNKSDVAIFSINSEEKHPPVVRVYFTILSKAWKKIKTSTALNGLASLNRGALERAIGYGAEILQVGVNSCVFEGCGEGCTSSIVATHDGNPLQGELKIFMQTDEGNIKIVLISILHICACKIDLVTLCKTYTSYTK